MVMQEGVRRLDLTGNARLDGVYTDAPAALAADTRTLLVKLVSVALRQQPEGEVRALIPDLVGLLAGTVRASDREARHSGRWRSVE